MTAQEDFQAFLNAQADPAYDFAAMTPEEQQAEMTLYTKLKIAVAQEAEIKKAFNAAKEAAFAALRAEQDIAIQALGQVWQTAEDNNYTVPQ